MVLISETISSRYKTGKSIQIMGWASGRWKCSMVMLEENVLRVRLNVKVSVITEHLLGPQLLF